jgi:hypothetical protein
MQQLANACQVLVAAGGIATGYVLNDVYREAAA